MTFNDHSKLAGSHAFLGASKYHWINYSDEKLVQTYINMQATERGTTMHDFASRCIALGQKLPRSTKALNMFVNDAIGYNMASEQILYYSDNCYGTADAISFRDNKLRIHDLKTGVTPGHMEQLYIYAALFCLEYHLRPEDIEMELRLYQGNEISATVPAPEDISNIMKKIVRFDKLIEDYNKEQEG